MRINGSTSSGSWTHRLEVTENSTNISNNTSSVTVRAYIGRGNSGSYMYGANIYCNINVTGCSQQTIHYSNSGRVNIGANSEIEIGSVTFTVPHNADGNKWIDISSSFSNNVSPSSGSASGGMSLSYIPRQANIGSAPNFNDEENPTITYSNPAGNSVTSLQACISLTGSKDDVSYRNINKTGSSYTFNLTDSERKVLRKACANSNSLGVIFYVKTVIGGNTFFSTLNRTMTIVNGAPIFTKFDYKDTNTNVVNVTGNDQILVKGLSNLSLIISDKMVATKESTAKNYLLSIDTINSSVDYSTETLNVSMGVVNSAGTKRLNVRAYDSRNNSTLAFKDIEVYEYEKPVINASIMRLNNWENSTTLKISGTYSKLNINNTDKNKVSSVQYRYRETNGTWSSWKTLTSTIADGKFNCNDVILSLDNTKSFEFEVQAIDKLSNTTNKLNLAVGQAIFFVSSNKKACYINGQEILTYDVVDTW